MQTVYYLNLIKYISDFMLIDNAYLKYKKSFNFIFS